MYIYEQLDYIDNSSATEPDFDHAPQKPRLASGHVVIARRSRSLRHDKIHTSQQMFMYISVHTSSKYVFSLVAVLGKYGGHMVNV